MENDNLPLFDAISRFQRRVLSVERNQQAADFTYADLEAIWNTIRKPLARFGLTVTQWPKGRVEDGIYLAEVLTVVSHASGAAIGETSAFPVKSLDPTEYGAVVGHLKRYALLSILGLPTVEKVKLSDATAKAVADMLNGLSPAQQLVALRKGTAQ